MTQAVFRRFINWFTVFPCLVFLSCSAWAAPQPPDDIPPNDIPNDIQWLTNDTDPVFASPEAKKGGIFRLAVQAFPPTFRTVGPDSNSSFRSYILGNQLSLFELHPNTLNPIPSLATHWAYGKDKRTMYFKLNPKARWSDGTPVTAEDFAFTLEFMRSPHIVAPWYNDYYSREIERVDIFDAHTIAVVAARAVPDLHLKLGIAPTPKHFYGGFGPDFVRRFNWKIAPNTGPYQISRFKKGKEVRFKRKKDWWAADLKYFKNRFNVDVVVVKVIRDFNLQWEYFRKGKLDSFPMQFPSYWHQKSDIPEIRNGYIRRLWCYTDTRQSAMGMWMNADHPLFSDLYLREAFAHAMNIEKVISRVLRNDYFRLESGYAGYGAYSHPDIRARRFDLEKIAVLMTEHGWRRGKDGIWEKDGRRFSVEVSYSHEEHTPRLTVLKEEARKAGIELRLQRLDNAAAYKKFMEKKHQVAWMGWSTSLRPRFWEHWHSVNAHKPQTNNITNTDDLELDTMIDRYRASLDETERIELSLKIQEKIHSLCPFVPTFMVPYVRQAYWRWWRLPEPPGTKNSDSLFDPFGTGMFWLDSREKTETEAAMKAGRTFPSDPVIDTSFQPASLKK